MNIELTEDEAMSLRSLLDVAVRAQGMRAAEFAMVIDAKIVAAAQTEQKEIGVTTLRNKPPGNGQGRPEL